jgi:hypothetical protein
LPVPLPDGNEEELERGRGGEPPSCSTVRELWESPKPFQQAGAGARGKGTGNCADKPRLNSLPLGLAPERSTSAALRTVMPGTPVD